MREVMSLIAKQISDHLDNEILLIEKMRDAVLTNEESTYLVSKMKDHKHWRENVNTMTTATFEKITKLED